MSIIEIMVAIILGLIIFCLIGMYLTNYFVKVILYTLTIFILTGILFLILEADYLAFMFLIIYAGAIIILFICCFMLMSFKITRNKVDSDEIIRLINYIIIVSVILFILISCSENIYIFTDIVKKDLFQPNTINSLIVQHQLFNYYFFHASVNAVEFSTITQIGIILFNEAWFETLFIGLLLLLAIVYIVYIFRK